MSLRMLPAVSSKPSPRGHLRYRVWLHLGFVLERHRDRDKESQKDRKREREGQERVGEETEREEVNCRLRLGGREGKREGGENERERGGARYREYEGGFEQCAQRTGEDKNMQKRTRQGLGLSGRALASHM